MTNNDRPTAPEPSLAGERATRSRPAVWATCAVLFLAAVAFAFASTASHGVLRGVFLVVSIALLACGGMIIGIRVARRADALVTRRAGAQRSPADDGS